MSLQSAVSDFLRDGLTSANDFYAKHERDDIFFRPDGLLSFGYWTPATQSKAEADENFCRMVAEQASLQPNDRVLDVGCGFGFHDRYFRARYGVSSIVAIDLAPQFIAEAKRRAGNTEGVEFRIGDAVRAGFPDDAFTRVVSFDAALHFRTREVFLSEASRMLESGGVLLLTDLIPLRLPVTFGERLRALRDAWECEVPLSNQYDAPHYERLLLRAGFVDVNIQSIRHRTMRGFLRYASERVREGVASGELTGKRLASAREFHLGLRVDYERETLDHVLVRAVKP